MYKILIIKNRYNKKVGLDKVVNFFKKKANLDFIIEEINTDFDLEFRSVGNGTYSGVVASNYYEKLRKIVKEGQYNAVVLYYGNKATGIRVSITESIPLYEDTDVIQVVENDNGKCLNHELFHAFFCKLKRKGINLHDPMDIAIVGGKPVPYFNNDDLDAKESNRTIALEALKNHWGLIQFINPSKGILASILPKKKYKYFSDNEVYGLKPELIEKLEKAREIAGIPFIITSGFRDKEHNNEVGGVKDSSHTKGLAVDLKADNNVKHFIITKALIQAGFSRISRTYPKHIHVDIDSTKPQNVLF